MKGEYYAATGRRKTAVAQVRLKMGKGEIQVNGKKAGEYFSRPLYGKIVRESLEQVDFLDRFDAVIEVQGGGLTGQAEAIRLGLARAIIKINPELRSNLKQRGFLTRDQRMKERKKPGLRGARAKPQSSKR